MSFRTVQRLVFNHYSFFFFFFMCYIKDFYSKAMSCFCLLRSESGSSVCRARLTPASTMSNESKFTLTISYIYPLTSVMHVWQQFPKFDLWK